jgi:predicted DNA binding protein
MGISETLKAEGKLSDIAERLGISRPTLYKYMGKYDEGETDGIPSDVLDYFGRYEIPSEPSEDVPASSDCRIITKCFSDGKRFMIVPFDSESEEGSEYRLILYTKFGREYRKIGTYYTKIDRDFFLIDDIVYSRDLFYCVYRCISEGGLSVIDTEYSSGMCQLRR